MNALQWLVLVGCVLAVGCDAGPQQSRGVHQVSWSISSPDETQVPGLDEACVLFGTFGDSAAVTLWTDGAGGSYSAGWDRERNAVHYEGRLKSQDARTIDVHAFTADGRSGDVTIDGQKFELAKGSLFLIKTADGETQVRQLNLELPQPSRTLSKPSKPPSETLRDFGMSNKEISGFFAEGGE